MFFTFNFQRKKKRPENFGFHSLVASQVILHSGEGLDFEKESQFYGIPTGKFENFGGILAALRILSKIAILRTPKHHALQVQTLLLEGPMILREYHLPFCSLSQMVSVVSP